MTDLLRSRALSPLCRGEKEIRKNLGL
jgi:hypothetical protein